MALHEIIEWLYIQRHIQYNGLELEKIENINEFRKKINGAWSLEVSFVVVTVEMSKMQCEQSANVNGLWENLLRIS